jgi:hypothetical protein
MAGANDRRDWKTMWDALLVIRSDDADSTFITRQQPDMSAQTPSRSDFAVRETVAIKAAQISALKLALSLNKLRSKIDKSHAP